MKEILMYILGVVVCSGLFTVFYRTVLHERASFRTARAFLPLSLVAAIVIPAFNIPVWRSAPIELPVVMEALPAQAGIPAIVAAPSTDWLQVSLWALYGVGIAVLGAIMIYQAVRIARMRRRAELYSMGGCEIAVSEEVSAPFSFLSTVYVEKGTPTDRMRQIVLHEASHVRHRHSAEKITMEALKTLMWFNPFAWWASRLLGEVHEFEADRDVLRGGFPLEEYLPVIFRQIFGYIPEISVGLGNSLTKKRFLMMKKEMKQTKLGWLRVAGALPLAAAGMMLFGFTHRAPEIIMVGAPTVAEVGSLTPATVEAPAEIADTQKPDTDTPLYTAEAMPVFQNGDLNTFRNWVMGQIRYPEEAFEKNITGKVVVKFVIEKDGSLSSIEEMASPGPLLTDEAVRVLNMSPKWTPGKQKGKTVRVFYIMPIDFKFQGDGDEPAMPVGAAPATAGTMKEVVVVGYGAQKKADKITVMVDNQTSVSQIVSVSSSSDGKGQPMYIVNTKRVSSLDAIDPNTIEKIDVLKDGMATAQYGPDAKNGVVVITLKGDGEQKVDVVTLPADKLTEMDTVTDIKQKLRDAGVTKITYVSSDDVAVTGSSGSGVVIRGISETTKDPFLWLDREKKSLSAGELSEIAPGGIESISVLKGASLDNLSDEIKAAMGDKKYEGVIVITTKR